MDGRVAKALRGGALWNEVKDKLNAFRSQPVRRPAAAALHCPYRAVRPEGDPVRRTLFGARSISTAKVEELIQELAEDYTIAIVTHNMQQAARVSDKTAFMYLGELIEFDDTNRIFTSPSGSAYPGLHYWPVRLACRFGSGVAVCMALTARTTASIRRDTWLLNIPPRRSDSDLQ